MNLNDLVAEATSLLSALGVRHCFLSRAKAVQFGGCEVHVIALEDLVAMKLASGRPRDDLDAEELILRNVELDREDLNEVASSLGVGAKAAHFLKDHA